MQSAQLPSCQENLYQVLPWCMVRAPLLPAEVFSYLALARDDNELERALRHTIETNDHIRYALFIASPSLSYDVERFLGGELPQRKKHRFLLSMLRYLVRMSTRPTPFGSFAGVAMVRLGVGSLASLGDLAHVEARLRPDMGWFFSLITSMTEKDPTIFRGLRLQTNPSLLSVGDRLFLPPGAAPQSIYIKSSPIVRHILKYASVEVAYQELRRSILAHFPQFHPEQVDYLLQHLCQQQVLVHNLFSLLLTDPFQACLQALPASQTAVRQLLEQTLTQCRAIDSGKHEQKYAKVLALQELMNAGEGQFVAQEKSTLKSFFQVDAHLPLEGQALPPFIGDLAARVATRLLQLSPLQRGPRYWQKYQEAFIERYGPMAFIPLLDLLNPDTGLGPLTTEENLSKPLDPRDLILLQLATQALNDECHAIEMTDEVFNRLCRHSVSFDELPPSLELYCQVSASSPEALAEGDFQMIVAPNCGSLGAGKSFGRFWDLWDQDEREVLRDLARAEEAAHPEILFAELTYLPLVSPSRSNLVIHPPLYTYQIPIGVSATVPTDRVLLLSDLVVGMQEHHLRIYSRSHQKEVRIREMHMLNPHSAPDAVRFLAEIERNGCPLLMPFDWGAASSLPFLPRLLYQSAVLQPAQWQLDSSLLGQIPIIDREWDAQFFQWRQCWHVPRFVYMVEGDNRLLLDLESPPFRQVLCDELENGRRVVLQECFPDISGLWLRDRTQNAYFSECVIPLRRREQEHSFHTNALPKSDFPQSVFDGARVFPPGSSWIYCKLYLSAQRVSTILVEQIQPFVAHLRSHGLIDRWFFVRYTDSEQGFHLRVRFHAISEDAQQALHTQVLDWMSYLFEQHMVRHVALDTYIRELERYGGPLLIEHVEHLFTLHSDMVSELLHQQQQVKHKQTPHVYCLLSLDHFLAAWGLSLEKRMVFLQSHGVLQTKEAQTFRPYRKILADVLAPWEYALPEALQLRERIEPLLAAQTTHIAVIASYVREAAERGEVWNVPENMLWSLLHMHVNRLEGIDRANEEQIYGWWLKALEAIHIRQKGRRMHTAKEAEVR